MLSIGALSQATGVKVPTIRYYEQIGLIAHAERSGGNQRRYDTRAVETLSFIRHGRELGFGLDAIRDLLELSRHPERPCAHADRLAQRQLEAVEARIARLTRLRHELKRMIEECASGTAGQCRVLESLADHGKCETQH